jgi:multidrug efflux system membrane fusion protein
LVLDRAIVSDQGLKYVYVVDAQNKVASRRVNVGALQQDGLRVIQDGLKPEDSVVISALQRVRPGMTVQPERQAMPVLEPTPERPAPPARQPK